MLAIMFTCLVVFHTMIWVCVECWVQKFLVFLSRFWVHAHALDRVDDNFLVSYEYEYEYEYGQWVELATITAK